MTSVKICRIGFTENFKGKIFLVFTVIKIWLLVDDGGRDGE